VELPNGTQRISLARILTAGALAVLLPLVSGAQQGTGGPFTRLEMLITAPAPLADAMKTSIGADSLQWLPVPDDAGGAQKSIITIFDDGFEGGIPVSWDVSGDGDVFWGDTGYRSHLGSRSVWCAGGGANGQPAGGDYVNNMNAWMIFGPFSLSDAVDGLMRFWLWNESELYHDEVMWGVSTDGESFGVVRMTGTTSGWAEQTIDFTDVSALGDVTGHENVWVAFIFSSDGSTTGEGAYIDDVLIEKNPGNEQPDLLVRSTSISNSTPGVGESFTINATVRNLGSLESESTTLRYYVSSDGTISGSDTEIGIGTVPALASGETSSQTLIASIDSSGTWWVGACVDSVAWENRVSNNCSIGVQVDVDGVNDVGTFSYFVPAIAHTSGVGTSYWRSKLGLLNRSGGRADVTLSYIHGGEITAITESIDHGALRTWDDAALSLFGVSAESSGSVLIISSRPLVITSRTYTEGADGTFGSFLPGVVPTEGVSHGEVGVLSQLSGNDDFRTNVGFVNLVDTACQVRVRVHAANGNQLGSPKWVNLGANGFKQVNNVFGATGSGTRNNAYAVVEVMTPGCVVWGYGAVIDGAAGFPGTDDATTMPLRVVNE